MKIFDIHTHIYPDAIAKRAVAALGKFYDFVPQGDGTFNDMTENDRRDGVCGFLIFSVATNAHQVHKVNECLAAVAEKAREDGFEAEAFGGLHQDCADMEGEINYALSLGLKGIKIHPDIQGVDIDDPLLFPLYELSQGKFPIYFHMGDDRPQYRFSEPKKLHKVLGLFPKMTVVAAHLGGYKADEEALTYLCGDERVMYDTSSALWWLSTERAEYLINRYGHERVMFGTDYPVMYPPDEIARFMKIKMTDAQREDIFYNNAKRFLKL